MPVKAACTVLVSPAQTEEAPSSVTVEVGRGLMVMVCELARSSEFPTHCVLAPRSTRADSLKVAVMGVFALVFTSVIGSVIVRLELVVVSTSTPLDENV